MLRRCKHALGLVVARAAATLIATMPNGVAAQNLPTDGTPVDNTIVVNGRRQSPDEVRREAGRIVASFGVATGAIPVARWVDPICPKVYGLRPEHARLVVDLVVSIARDAVVPIAKAPCRPNIAITFAADGGRFIRTMAAKSARTLAEVPQDQRERLFAGSNPVGWWYSTEARSDDGMAGGTDAPVWTAGSSAGGGSAIPSGGRTIAFSSLYKSSVISTQSIRAIRQAIVVIDVPKSEGVRLDAVAAYAAMVSLAEVRFTPEPAPESIMSLFGTGRQSTGLTPWDAAFLSALYKLPLDREAIQQRGALRTRVVARMTSGK